jgi:hypothetical protein
VNPTRTMIHPRRFRVLQRRVAHGRGGHDEEHAGDAERLNALIEEARPTDQPWVSRWSGRKPRDRHIESPQLVMLRSLVANR